MKLLERIKVDEGFRGTVYKCSLGHDTIGYGTKLPLSKKEAELLAQLRLDEKIEGLNSRLDWLNDQPKEVKEILYEMAYQMGVTKLMSFKNTLSYIQKKEYFLASEEMLDSKWALQTPNRANLLSAQMMMV